MDVVLTTDARGHSAYAELVASPPPGVRYHARPLHWGHRHTDSRLEDWVRWKRHALRRAALGEPAAFPAPDWGHPVHAANALLRSPRPWVCDFEHPWCFTGFDARLLRARRDRLARALGEARLLLPWTEAARRAVVALMPEMEPRVRVAYPAIAPRAPAEPDPDAPLVLFVAKLFERKGGPEAIEAFARVRRDHPRARMLMVTDAPPGIRAEGVEFLPASQPRERVLAEYAHASAYLMPTQFDTFGMVFLEAFAHAVPVVTLDGFGIREIVEDGRDGFVVPGYARTWFGPDMLPDPGAAAWDALRLTRTADERERVVRDLADRLGALLADPAKRAAMGAAAHRKVTEGRFSNAERGRHLLGLYRDAFG